MRAVQAEAKDLADQNAKLILNNAELKGKVKAYEQSLPSAS